MHFSTAVGTPTLCLFGGENPKKWGPWGSGHVVLQRGGQADLISVDEVYQAVHQIIQKSHENGFVKSRRSGENRSPDSVPEKAGSH